MRIRGAGIRRTSQLAVVAIGTALLFAGCGVFGGDEAPASTPTPPTEATPTPSPEPTPEPTPALEWPPVGEASILTDELNVRVGPGREYAVLGRLFTGDEIPISGRAPGGLWMAIPGVGWVFYDESWVELPTAFEDLPVIEEPDRAWEITGPVHSRDTSSGLPVVDEVAFALSDGSAARLSALAAAEEPPTVALAAAGPCPDSLLPGTELAEHVDQLLVSEANPDAGTPQLYAVVRGPALEDSDPEFVAVFAFDGGEGRQLWISPEGEITRFNLGCEEEPTLPGEFMRLGAEEAFFWFRPPVPEPLRPVE